ncbi:unnamed protein product, partial [Staurois parvus]
IAACCPRPLPSGRFPPVARDPCPGVDCRLLPKVPAQCSAEAPSLGGRLPACCPRPLLRGRL